jgi:hypothetical protein
MLMSNASSKSQGTLNPEIVETAQNEFFFPPNNLNNCQKLAVHHFVAKI